MVSQKDKHIVRELAKQYMAMLCTEKQERMTKRFRDTNDLKLVRPPVILDEIPWYQMNMDGELTCLCEDPTVRGSEFYLRIAIFYMKHFKADHLYEPFLRVTRAVHSTGMGISPAFAGERRTDNVNHIISREFEDVLEDESALEAMRIPEFSVSPDEDAGRMEYYTDLFGDSIPIKLTGFGYFYYAPWDKISRLRGVEPIYIDLYDRPEYLHRIIGLYTAAAQAELDFAERNLEIESVSSLHCTPGAVSGLAENGLKATWCRSMAQLFGAVSPEMFKEFEVDYLLPISRDTFPTVTCTRTIRLRFMPTAS